MESCAEGRRSWRSTKSRGRRIMLVAAAVVMAGGATLASVSPASAATLRIGGIDVSKACAEQVSGWAWLKEHNAFGWRCMTSGEHSVDMGRACRVQYAHGDAFAAFSNRNDPFSWSCYLNVL